MSSNRGAAVPSSHHTAALTRRGRASRNGGGGDLRFFCKGLPGYGIDDALEFVGRLDDLFEQDLSPLVQLLQHGDDRDCFALLLRPIFQLGAEDFHVAALAHQLLESVHLACLDRCGVAGDRIAALPSRTHSAVLTIRDLPNGESFHRPGTRASGRFPCLTGSLPSPNAAFCRASAHSESCGSLR